MEQKQYTPILFGFTEISEIINQNIVIWGTGHAQEILIDLLECPYNLCYYCDNNSKQWGKKIGETTIISPLQLKELLVNHKDYIIIIASVFNIDIKQQLQEELHITNRIIISDQLIPVLYEKKYFYKFKDNKEVIGEKIYKERWLFDKNKLVNEPPSLVMYASPKVGNTSVHVALGNTAFVATMFSMYHSMDRLRFSDEEKKICANKVKKIIIGVRDAIAQNISMVYEMEIQEFYCLLFGKDGRDAQKIFQFCVDDSICHEKEKRQRKDYGFEQLHKTPFLIQSWFDDVFFKDFKIDVFQLPFNKKEGYSIYKNINGYDILIYQLEKLNNLENVFREFSGYKKFKLKKKNNAEEKWYANSYKQFKDNVKMSKEYVEKTYSGKMMQHFYSKEDIAIFEKKWKKNIL